jgi:hypothetical protein
MVDKTVLLNRFARLVAGSPSRPLPERLAEACRDILDVEGVSITLEAATPNRVTLAAIDQISTELEELQDVLQQGPCFDAYMTGAPQVTDLGEGADRRWPEFGPAARAAVGPRTVFGLPMQPERQVLGVISVHLKGSLELPVGLETALFMADTVGAALLLDPHQHDPYGHAGPWSSRAQVHQATGMVIAQLQVSATDALAMLRAHAYAHNTAMGDVAAQVIGRELDFATADPEPED